MKKLISLLLVFVMAFSLIACGAAQAGDGSTVVVEDGETYGEGASEFTLTVTDKEGKESTATIRTDKATVGEALVELNLIAGHETEYGLYVDSVSGTTLSWDEDQMYWSFYVDGEYAMTGVDSTEIAAGSVYALKAEKG